MDYFDYNGDASSLMALPPPQPISSFVDLCSPPHSLSRSDSWRGSRPTMPHNSGGYCSAEKMSAGCVMSPPGAQSSPFPASPPQPQQQQQSPSPPCLLSCCNIPASTNAPPAFSPHSRIQFPSPHSPSFPMPILCSNYAPLQQPPHQFRMNVMLPPFIHQSPTNSSLTPPSTSMASLPSLSSLTSHNTSNNTSYLNCAPTHSQPAPASPQMHNIHNTHTYTTNERIRSTNHTNSSSLERLVFFIDLPHEDPRMRRLTDRLLLLGARVEQRLEGRVTHVVTSQYFTLEMMKAISQSQQTFLASSNPSSPMREPLSSLASLPPLSPLHSLYPSPAMSSPASSSFHLYDITRPELSSGASQRDSSSFLPSIKSATWPYGEQCESAPSVTSQEHRSYLEHLGIPPEISLAFCAGKKIYHVDKFLPWLDRKYEEFFCSSKSSFTRKPQSDRRHLSSQSYLHKSMPAVIDSTSVSQTLRPKTGFICVEDLEGKFLPLYKEFGVDEEGRSTFPSLNFDAPPGLSPFLRPPSATPSISKSSKSVVPNVSLTASTTIPTAPSTSRKSSYNSMATLGLPSMVVSCSDVVPPISDIQRSALAHTLYYPTSMEDARQSSGQFDTPSHKRSLLRHTRHGSAGFSSPPQPRRSHGMQQQQQQSGIASPTHLTLPPMHIHGYHNRQQQQYQQLQTPSSTTPCMNSFDVISDTTESSNMAPPSGLLLEHVPTFATSPSTIPTSNSKHRVQYVTDPHAAVRGHYCIREETRSSRKRKGQESGEERTSDDSNCIEEHDAEESGSEWLHATGSSSGPMQLASLQKKSQCHSTQKKRKTSKHNIKTTTTKTTNNEDEEVVLPWLFHFASSQQHQQHQQQQAGST